MQQLAPETSPRLFVEKCAGAVDPVKIELSEPKTIVAAAETANFVESWSNRDLWERHMSGNAIKEFNADIAGGFIVFELQELDRVA